VEITNWVVNAMCNDIIFNSQRLDYFYWRFLEFILVWWVEIRTTLTCTSVGFGQIGEVVNSYRDVVNFLPFMIKVLTMSMVWGYLWHCV
jgi:hypothetical protein